MTNDFQGWDDTSEAVQLGNPKYDDDVAEMWKAKNDALIQHNQNLATAAQNTIAGPVAGNGVIQSDNTRETSFVVRWGEFVAGVDKLQMIAARETDGQQRIVIYQGPNIYGTHRNIETAERWLREELKTKDAQDEKRKLIEEGGPKVIESMDQATADAELKKNGVVPLAARVDGIESKLDRLIALLEGQKSGD